MNSKLKRKNFKFDVSLNDIRLNDRTAARTLTLLSIKELHVRFSAKFNSAEMIRATRVPLEHAFKKFIKTGMSDVYEAVVPEDE